MNCKGCASYNNGRGSKRCVESCGEFNKVVGRSKPCVDYVQVSKQMLENLSIELDIDYYKILDPKDAVLLFLRYHLKLSLREIAEYKQISHQAVDSKIKRILNILNTYRINRPA